MYTNINVKLLLCFLLCRVLCLRSLSSLTPHPPGHIVRSRRTAEWINLQGSNPQNLLIAKPSSHRHSDTINKYVYI